MKPDELAAILARPGYTIAPVAPRLRHPIAQSANGQQPIRVDEAPQKGAGRFIVCITRYSVGTLDRDNLWGGAKAVCDALRYAGHIPDDDPASIHLVVRQKKCRRKDQGTEILIYPIT